MLFSTIIEVGTEQGQRLDDELVSRMAGVLEERVTEACTERVRSGVGPDQTAEPREKEFGCLLGEGVRGMISHFSPVVAEQFRQRGEIRGLAETEVHVPLECETDQSG